MNLDLCKYSGLTLSSILVTVLLFAGGQQGHSQATFVNLDFESVIPPLNRDLNFQVPITNALPGWTGYIGTNQTDQVGYNTRNLSAAGISLHDSGSASLQPIQGNYSVFLQGQFNPNHLPLDLPSASIAQLGQIPANANSLTFWAAPATTFQVTFNGQLISIGPITTTANYDILGGNISPFAGQIGELRFTALSGYGGLFDNIQFSNQAVPEPSVLGLSVIGGLLLGWRLRRNSSRP